MCRSEDWFTLRIKTHIRSTQEAIATQDLLLLWTPNNQLPIGILHRVKLVNIGLLARTSAIIAESDLPQASNLLHHMRRVMSGYDVNLIARLVGASEPFLWCQLSFQQSFFYGLDNLLFVHNVCITLTDKRPLSPNLPTRLAYVYCRTFAREWVHQNKPGKFDAYS